jgi:hypothetical protein
MHNFLQFYEFLGEKLYRFNALDLIRFSQRPFRLRYDVLGPTPTPISCT